MSRPRGPVAPMVRTWKPIVLARADEFRPPPPPAFDSDTTKAAITELNSFQRTPKTNHRANHWEVFGGARAHALWNEIARVKLLEAGDRFDAAASARLLAALIVALFDAGVACWDAKYEYWYIRASQLDPELNPLFPSPNHRRACARSKRRLSVSGPIWSGTLGGETTLRRPRGRATARGVSACWQSPWRR